MQQQDKQMMMVLAFVAGVMVGANWPKIKKALEPFIAGMTDKAADIYVNMAKFMAEQKETVEDKVAEKKTAKKKKTTKRKKKPTRKSIKVSV